MHIEALLLAVFEEEIIARSRGVNPIDLESSYRGIYSHLSRVGEFDGRSPMVDIGDGVGAMTGRSATVVVPGTRRHNVVGAESTIFATRLAVVGVVIVGSAEDVAQLVADHADIGQLSASTSTAFGRAGIRSESNSVIGRRVPHVPLMTPDAVGASASLFTIAGKENMYTINDTIAVIVVAREVGHAFGLGDHFRSEHILALVGAAIIAHLAVAGNRSNHIDSEVELVVGGLVIEVADTAVGPIFVVALLVEEHIDIAFAVGKRAILSLEENHESTAFADHRSLLGSRHVGVREVFPNGEIRVDLSAGEAKMTRSIGKKRKDLGRTRLRSSGPILRRHNAAEGVTIGIAEIAERVIEESVSILRLGPMDLFVAFEVDVELIAIVGLLKLDKTRESRHGESCNREEKEYYDEDEFIASLYHNNQIVILHDKITNRNANIQYFFILHIFLYK